MVKSINIEELSDMQAEAGVIGTLLYHPEFIVHTDYLKPGHFYHTENSCLYWAIQELCAEGIANIDAYNISSKLQSNSAVSRTIEKYNLPTIQESCELLKEVARHTIEEYKMLAANVFTFTVKRDYVKTLNQLYSETFIRESTLDELINKTYDQIDKLTTKYITSTEVKPLGDDIDSIWDEIVSRRTEDGIYGIASKYPSFGEYFTYEPGELVVIQAKYKEGKSVFLMNEVVHKLKNGVPVLVIDSEMQTRLYVERLLAHLSGVDVKRLKNGNYSVEEEKHILYWKNWLKEQPFVHRYEPEITNEGIYSLCQVLKNQIDLQFVVFDYLKSNEVSTGDNYNVLGAKCDYLKNIIAGKLNLAVLAACQLNRNGEVADSIKINRYLSVGIRWGFKTQEMKERDGMQCGNAYAKIYVNRLGSQMPEDDPMEYIDFHFDGDRMKISEAEPHNKESYF